MEMRGLEPLASYMRIKIRYPDGIELCEITPVFARCRMLHDVAESCWWYGAIAVQLQYAGDVSLDEDST
jgi:hypothetical protein